MHSVTILSVLTVLGAAASIQAVVHGIQPAGNRYDLSTANRNGYRYNGPAHKYLPAPASAPATGAVATTGHWQPYENSYSSKPTSQQQQQGYNGPYSMQYYDREEQTLPSTGNSWKQQQQQQQSGSSWRPQETQKLQQLSGSAWGQPQMSGSAWQKQPQSQQLFENSYHMQQHHADNSWQQQQQGQHWQQEQHGGRQQHPAQHTTSTTSVTNNNKLNTFPYVSEHNKIAAAPSAMDQFGASYGVSSAANHNRLLESDMRDTQLVNQALPERYQQQLFAAPETTTAMRQPVFGQHSAGAANFMQMQSNSYELPSSYHMQREYPNQQSSPPKDYDSFKPLEKPESSFAQYATHGQDSHFGQPDYYHDTPSHSHSSSAVATNSMSSSSSHLAFQPSREFQAPYY